MGKSEFIMKDLYIETMDKVYLVCIWAAGLSVCIMTTIIPIQVVARKWFDSGLSWPEPTALICMIVFTFIGAAAAYRAGSHIAVTVLTDRLKGKSQQNFKYLVDALMALVALFVIYYGIDRILFFMTTGQTLPDFPSLKVFWTYVPLPLGSFLTLLFIIESMLFGPQNHRPVVMIGSHS